MSDEEYTTLSGTFRRLFLTAQGYAPEIWEWFSELPARVHQTQFFQSSPYVVTPTRQTSQTQFFRGAPPEPAPRYARPLDVLGYATSIRPSSGLIE